ncbi:MAG: peptidoglycan recognition protein family protein, partial [Acidobacteriia bacterium]|nr:peptidoglycan recognition protein family protein [Terriglobia bacterium]
SETNELYSNGLRIDRTYTVPNRPRAKFSIYALNGSAAPIKTGETPVGIVYHMSESLVAPFEENQTRRLKQLGRNLLEVIRGERAYHYVIDRFGRVYSVVAESDAANHAGNSIWSDAEGIYVNLNDSFLGVSFEGQTESSDEVTPAQINAARLLTEMLRSRYSIAAENCITHAQVSVNPANMRVGNHIDWAQNFPFAAVGLPNNYAIPLASVYVFGFKFDDAFLTATGGRWKGLDLAVAQLERQAAVDQTPVVRYRKILQRRYQDIAAVLKEQAEGGSE